MTELDPRSLRVYVITSASFAGRAHRDVAEAAIAGGATAVQLRAPELSDRELLPVATGLAARCADAGVLFLVNDRPGVAVESGADGAHVGQGDDPASARARLGPGRVLGISVDSIEELDGALGYGADYVACTVWPTPTKPGAVPGGTGLVARIAAASPVPVVGIGGIGASNAAEVISAGAAGVAVVSAVAAADDPAVATRELVAAVGAIVDRT